MRKLQYILNVLGYHNVLNKHPVTDAYVFPGVDPFYITDEKWDEMQREFDDKFMGGQNGKTRTG